MDKRARIQIVDQVDLDYGHPGSVVNSSVSSVTGKELGGAYAN